MNFNDTERVIMAQYIAEDNLAHANEVAAPVNVKNTFYTRYGKRILDIIISGFALLITLPINLIIGIITYFDVGRPIFFRQNRIGKDCKEFKIIKFRNMTNETDAQGNLLLPKDRVTKWGNFVRRTSLDELLNFWSILKGDMSIIGPRPLVSSYLLRYSDRHIMRHVVRPGLECPNISLNSNTGNKWHDQFENDIWYVENISFLTDVKMLLGLVRLVFDHREIVSRGEAKRGSFMGYDEKGIAMNNTDIPQKYIERMRAEYGEIVTKESLFETERDYDVEVLLDGKKESCSVYKGVS